MTTTETVTEIFTQFHKAKAQGIIHNIIYTHTDANAYSHFILTFNSQVQLTSIKTLQGYLATHYNVFVALRDTDQTAHPLLELAIPNVHIADPIWNLFYGPEETRPPRNLPFI